MGVKTWQLLSKNQMWQKIKNLTLFSIYIRKYDNAVCKFKQMLFYDDEHFALHPFEPSSSFRRDKLIKQADTRLHAWAPIDMSLNVGNTFS